MRFAPARLDAQGRVKLLRRHVKQGAKPAPLPCLATDTIERIRDGIRRDLISFIDPASAFASAVALPGQSPRQTRAALEATLALLPQPPRVLLSNNGSEFEAGFAQVLAEQRIARWYTYPKTPKMNTSAERFHRTLPESFVDDYEDLLFTDLALFNQKLADGLVFDNAERPHHRLGQKPPLSFLLHINPSAKGGGRIHDLDNHA
jgi:transposase InsO family protein